MLAWFYPGLLTTFALGKNKLTSYWSKRVISNHKKKILKNSNTFAYNCIVPGQVRGKKGNENFICNLLKQTMKTFSF